MVHDIRIPYWLLKLLPMWDYVCPKCKREVKQKSRKCPYCGENYGSPLRVPPRVLKDKKALEDYVHKHIFPKISPNQREYLAQFFTTIFSDGFESGDFSAWTGTSGVTCSVENINPHHGVYNAKFVSVAGARPYVYKSGLTSSAIMYHRSYYKFDTLPASQDESIYICAIFASGSNFADVVIKYSGGAKYWGIAVSINDVFSLYFEASASNPVTGTYYCIELKRDVTNGLVTLWVDDTQKVNQSVANVGNSTYVRDGIMENDCVATQTIYVDCVVVADTYIGPEVAVVPVGGTVQQAKLQDII